MPSDVFFIGRRSLGDIFPKPPPHIIRIVNTYIHTCIMHIYIYMSDVCIFAIIGAYCESRRPPLFWRKLAREIIPAIILQGEGVCVYYSIPRTSIIVCVLHAIIHTVVPNAPFSRPVDGTTAHRSARSGQKRRALIYIYDIPSILRCWNLRRCKLPKLPIVKGT